MRSSARTLATLSLLLGACTSAPGPTQAVTSPTPLVGVSIPAEGLPADIQCLVDRGSRLVQIDQPAFPGDPPGYRLESDLSMAEQRAISIECEKLRPAQPEKSDAEVQVVYDRWLGQRECLIGLGYRPEEPPSFETFLSDWRGDGPWTPLDGVNTRVWSSADYSEAKERCTLEFYDRD